MRQWARIQRHRCKALTGSLRRPPLTLTAALAAAALVAAACSGDSSTGQPAPDEGGGTPTILATTGIWADVVSNVACDGLAQVDAVIPIGGDPHGYEPSMQDTTRMEDAALVVANGLNLEESLEDTLEAVAASGTPVYEIAEEMDTIPYTFETAHDDHDEDGHDEDEAHDDHDEDEAHDDHDEDGHDDDGHDDDGHDDDGHGHSGDDPHVWFDPHRVSDALPRLAQLLTTEAGLDSAAVQACLDSYVAELEAVDAEIAAKVEELPAENRKLVTNHEALGYYADRYGFEIIGTVIPSPSSMAQASPTGLERLAETIEHEGIKAIFAETQHSGDDAEALASQVGDVDVVTLYTGSLGPPGSGAETYVGYLRTNTDLIVDALG